MKRPFYILITNEKAKIGHQNSKKFIFVTLIKNGRRNLDKMPKKTEVLGYISILI